MVIAAESGTIINENSTPHRRYVRTLSRTVWRMLVIDEAACPMAALERLAHATTNKGYSPASPLQALVLRAAAKGLRAVSFAVAR